MHVFQTAGVPPKSGRIILPINGCTRNSSKALQKRVKAKKPSINAGKAGKRHLRRKKAVGSGTAGASGRVILRHDARKRKGCRSGELSRTRSAKGLTPPQVRTGPCRRS